ncbi:MAG TPA: hypothetical protein VNY31_10480 [Solirubrobacteraceae bacterium]|jgi:hypothetical protein|nr:hypothetical protein [Solirubrobacteraceae bacterium]
MPTHTLSPLEETVLNLIGAHWWTLEELQTMLSPEYCPEAVKTAIAYLRRRCLLSILQRRYGQPFYEQTALGFQTLCVQRRDRIQAYKQRETAHAA